MLLQIEYDEKLKYDRINDLALKISVGFNDITKLADLISKNDEEEDEEVQRIMFEEELRNLQNVR